MGFLFVFNNENDNRLRHDSKRSAGISWHCRNHKITPEDENVQLWKRKILISWLLEDWTSNMCENWLSCVLFLLLFKNIFIGALQLFMMVEFIVTYSFCSQHNLLHFIPGTFPFLPLLLILFPFLYSTGGNTNIPTYIYVYTHKSSIILIYIYKSGTLGSKLQGLLYAFCWSLRVMLQPIYHSHY